MILKSFGCSFIFGSDLEDAGTESYNPSPSQQTWPALLAQHHGFDYQCYARPGCGNLQIAERVLSHLADPQPCCYIIGWTWIDRFDYTHRQISNDPVQSQWCNWNTILPGDTDLSARNYYKDLHSEFRDKLCSLMHIKLVIDSLIRHGRPFLMTYMDELLFDQQWHVTPAVIDLQKSIRPFMTQFDQQCFLDWSKSQGFEISAKLHPLEKAHSAAAMHLIQRKLAVFKV